MSVRAPNLWPSRTLRDQTVYFTHLCGWWDFYCGFGGIFTGSFGILVACSSVGFDIYFRVVLDQAD